MAEREEVVKTLAAVFVVQSEKRDQHNYPYQSDVSVWGDHLQAHEALTTTFGNQDKMRIILRHINVLSSGRVVNDNVKTIYENKTWVSGEHDPRAKDPQYREYLRLKRIYDDDD